MKKKFNGYQLETVIHENCSRNRTARYIKRYNEHSSMNTNQKAFTYIDKFAKRIRKLMDSSFFIDCNVCSESDFEKGAIERIIVETIMCTHHFEGWSKEARKLFQYINDNGTEKEFDLLEEHLNRLGNVITDDIKDIFNKKDSFIFLTLFERFTESGMSDIKFADFLREFKFSYRLAERNSKGLLFDEIKQNSNSTKDRQVIAGKLDMLERLMNDFLYHEDEKSGFNKEKTCLKNEKSGRCRVEKFIAETLGMDEGEVEEDMDIYNEDLDGLLENTVKLGSGLRSDENRPSLLAMVVYSYKNDVFLDDWMKYYAAVNHTYFADQRKNFIHMKQEFEQYCTDKCEKNF